MRIHLRTHKNRKEGGSDNHMEGLKMGLKPLIYTRSQSWCMRGGAV